MSTTFVPDPRPIDPKVTMESLLAEVHELHLRAQGDEDKAGTIDDSNYYAGFVDALKYVEVLMTDCSAEENSEKV